MSNMRIGGLASGMDTDTIIGELMKAERIPLDKLTQKKTQLEWQRDDYRSMNKLLDDLDRLVFDGINRQGKFLTKNVTSSAPTIVSATANGSAVNTTSNITVSNTATAAIWVGGNTLASNYTVASATQLKFDVVNGDGTAANGVTIDLKAGDNIDTIVSKFNSSGLGVTAFYDATKSTFVLSKKETGVAASIKVADAATATFMNTDLKFTSAATSSELTGKTAGKDASFTINGYSTTRSSNTFTISGVTYTLQQAGTANISIANNVDSTVDLIKSFVDKYNETITSINDKISETKYRKYPPLTDEQRKGLSDKEAELWDEKAKSGMLRSDTILSSGLNSMRQDLYTVVNTGDAKYDQLSEIGITTSSIYQEKGKLEIDEKKLRDALAANPDAVMKLFTGNGGTAAGDIGIASKLRESIDNTVKKIELKAGNSLRTNAQFTLGRELNDMDNRISAFQDRLTQVENRYWRQFTAMEKAIQQSNQQMGYLMQQFGGGQ